MSDLVRHQCDPVASCRLPEFPKELEHFDSIFQELLSRNLAVSAEPAGCHACQCENIEGPESCSPLLSGPQPSSCPLPKTIGHNGAQCAPLDE